MAAVPVFYHHLLAALKAQSGDGDTTDPVPLVAEGLRGMKAFNRFVEEVSPNRLTGLIESEDLVAATAFLERICLAQSNICIYKEKIYYEQPD